MKALSYAIFSDCSKTLTEVIQVTPMGNSIFCKTPFQKICLCDDMIFNPETAFSLAA